MSIVLKLQQRVKAAYDREGRRPQIVIYGKLGHAEVNGLVGQTDGQAIVVESVDDLDKLDFTRDIALFSQTTKSLEGYRHIIAQIESRKHPDAAFEHYDTICRSVSGRVERLRSFAAAHEVVLFVAGTKSSNGRILYDQCRAVNPHTSHSQRVAPRSRMAQRSRQRRHMRCHQHSAVADGAGARCRG